MKTKSWFEAWFNSPYYKVLYQNRDNAEADFFSDALLQYLQPKPASKILDIGCGEGRFSIQFANKGFDVTGIDIAENSIEKAIENEHDKLHFYVQDMRLPFYINYFDYSFNLFTSFGYFDTERDNRLAAHSFAKGLKIGARLVIDYLNKDWVLQRLKPFEIVERGGVSFEINKEYDGRHIIKHIRFVDAEANQQHYTERVSAFSLADFSQLFTNAGMQLEASFGSYSLDPYDSEQSERLIMVFKKVAHGG
jgi:SAM-dependent methyltransferase